MATKEQTVTSSALNVPTVQNFHLVWLHVNIHEINDQYLHSIMKLKEIINTINIFVDVDRCVDFITDTKETAFVVVCGTTSQALISIIQGIVQVSSVYLFCETKFQYEKCLKECLGTSGVYTDMAYLSEALKEAIDNFNQNIFSISFSKTGDTLNCSFMYTQMLKDILLTIDFDEQHFHEFLTFCRKVLADNSRELQKVERMERDYNGTQAIRWYMYESFLYS